MIYLNVFLETRMRCIASKRESNSFKSRMKKAFQYFVFFLYILVIECLNKNVYGLLIRFVPVTLNKE
jgi:hypothetical protein